MRLANIGDTIVSIYFAECSLHDLRSEVNFEETRKIANELINAGKWLVYRCGKCHSEVIDEKCKCEEHQ